MWVYSSFSPSYQDTCRSHLSTLYLPLFMYYLYQSSSFCRRQHCTMHLHFLLYLVAHLALESAASYAECYAPDGSTGYAYLPCVADLNVDSMCCVLNLTALEAFGDTVANLDTCLPNGLCLSNFGQYSRDLCTDKTWQSPNCLNICTGGSVSLVHPALLSPSLPAVRYGRLTEGLVNRMVGISPPPR
jgi:hypothetical protein